MLVEQELTWYLYRKDGVFSFWLSALVENNEAIALSLAARFHLKSGTYFFLCIPNFNMPNKALVCSLLDLGSTNSKSMIVLEYSCPKIEKSQF